MQTFKNDWHLQLLRALLVDAKTSNMSWFETPVGARRRLTAEEDSRPDIKLELRQKDGDNDKMITVTIKASMQHLECKNEIINAIGESGNLAPDQICLYSKNQKRVPCAYDVFFNLDQTESLTVHTTLESWERALERADIIRFHQSIDDGPCEIRFQPSDLIFANRSGLVRDDATEELFVSARLCEKWVVDKYIQSGSFGRGWHAVDAYSKKKVFVKTFRSFSDRPRPRGARKLPVPERKAKQEASIRKEVEVLLHPKFIEMCNHPNVVSNLLCYGSVSVPTTDRKGEMFFIMSEDLCEGGELFNYLCPPEPPYVRSFSESTTRRIFRQIASGVAHIHSVGAYHRDLKLENIVVDANFDIKIMDYGSVKFTDQMSSITNEETGERMLVATTYAGVGTGGYKPIEARKTTKAVGYDPAAFDVWSVGVILLYLAVGEKIYDKVGGGMCFQFIETLIMEKDHQYKSFLSPPGEVDPIDNAPQHSGLWKFLEEDGDLNLTDELKHLINLMLNLDPTTRITIERVLKHDWLDEPDAPDEQYFSEMHSRPITEGQDLMLKLVWLSCDTEARQEVIDSIPMDTNGKPYEMVVKENSVEVGLTDEGHELYAIYFTGNCEVVVRWVGGSLAQWLVFRLKLKECLGLRDQTSIDLEEAQKEFADHAKSP